MGEREGVVVKDRRIENKNKAHMNHSEEEAKHMESADFTLNKPRVHTCGQKVKSKINK